MARGLELATAILSGLGLVLYRHTLLDRLSKLIEIQGASLVVDAVDLVAEIDLFECNSDTLSMETVVTKDTEHQTAGLVAIPLGLEAQGGRGPWRTW